jgi:hypothetical protein
VPEAAARAGSAADEPEETDAPASLDQVLRTAAEARRRGDDPHS